MNQNEQLQTLVRIEQKVDGLSGSVATLNERMDRVETKLFIGNGSPSFEKRITIIEERLGQNSEQCKACWAAKVPSKIVYAVISVVFVLLSGLALAHSDIVLNLFK